MRHLTDDVLQDARVQAPVWRHRLADGQLAVDDGHPLGRDQLESVLQPGDDRGRVTTAVAEQADPLVLLRDDVIRWRPVERRRNWNEQTSETLKTRLLGKMKICSRSFSRPCVRASVRPCVRASVQCLCVCARACVRLSVLPYVRSSALPCVRAPVCASVYVRVCVCASVRACVRACVRPSVRYDIWVHSNVTVIWSVMHCAMCFDEYSFHHSKTNSYL